MSDKMREDFECWVRRCNKANKLGHMYLNVSESGIYYLDNRTELAYQAWQASRAAVVVELPSVYIVDDAYIDADSRDPNDSYLSEDDVKQSITAAGVSYK